jgi:putative transposase
MKDRRRLNAACNETEVSLKTYRRWLCGDEITVDKRCDAIRPEPGNKLSEQEHQRMIETCNEPEYANLPPSQIVPILLDDDIYHASSSNHYRVLKQANQSHHRGRSLAPKNVGKRTRYGHGISPIWLPPLRVSFTIYTCLKIFLAER